MRLINQFDGIFPASLARVDNLNPMTGRSRTGYSRRVTASMSAVLNGM